MLEITQWRRVLLLSINLAPYQLVNIRYEKKVIQYCKYIINECLSQILLVLYPLVLTVQSNIAAVYPIDLSWTPCIPTKVIWSKKLCIKST